MIAHIRKSDNSEQSVYAHCKNVAELSSNVAKTVGLSAITRLCGMLHDEGKLTELFGKYIKGDTNEKVNHSPVGAIYAFEKWYNGDTLKRLTAQIISLVIRGHHGGLPDCANTDGKSSFYNSLIQDKSKLNYYEAVNNYSKMCLSDDILDELFEAACKEITSIISTDDNQFHFNAGMLARFILSCIVDADRWDSACFEYGISPFEEEKAADWQMLLDRMECYIKEFPAEKEMDKIRQRISLCCYEAGTLPKGIYTLNVPTGGGKTLSSLRFALRHINENNMSRLFYVIPYNTILEQNSEDIKDALGDYEGILNHYGNFISEKDGKEGEAEEARHQLFSERWTSPIILTSMVQFLNSAFKGGNTYSRRFCRLANSIIVFDEIQALPKKCTVMFERLIKFLAEKLGCTILLCTATQPGLNVEALPLINTGFFDTAKHAFDRVKIKSLFSSPEDVITYSEAAIRLEKRVGDYGSALMIVNTKKAAAEIFGRISKLLPDDCLKIHLSTMMCPAHRTEKISQMKEALKQKRPVCCVSTALIEAGVNISFPCVIRSLAGLSSVIQSAGRCNRHMELGAEGGNVEVWYLREENLSRLPDISVGQNGTHDILRRFGELNDSVQEMDRYFEFEKNEHGKTLLYPYKKTYFLSSMISENSKCRKENRELRKNSDTFVLYQAFSEVGSNFEVIDEDTVSVVVPYDGSVEIINGLAGNPDLKRRLRLLKEAQNYAVSVYKSQLVQMSNKDMVYPLGDTGAVALKKEFYDDSAGVIFKSMGMEYLGY